MHVIAAFFAFLFSFGHAQSLQARHSDAFIPPAEYAVGMEYAVPSHQDILNGKYAEAGCPGCNMTTSSSNVRSN